MFIVAAITPAKVWVFGYTPIGRNLIRASAFNHTFSCCVFPNHSPLPSPSCFFFTVGPNNSPSTCPATPLPPSLPLADRERFLQLPLSLLPPDPACLARRRRQPTPVWLHHACLRFAHVTPRNGHLRQHRVSFVPASLMTPPLISLSSSEISSDTMPEVFGWTTTCTTPEDAWAITVTGTWPWATCPGRRQP
ncbi:hypothetical protein FRC12_001031 [Ceratobasidium sp. 428]|nr:hypothetical protein FRC12_001031 [Ceratobasidium sp. 428]